MLLLVSAYGLVGRTLKTPRTELLVPADGDRRWVDCYSSADPVPNGALYESYVPVAARLRGGRQPGPYRPVRTYNSGGCSTTM